MGRLPGNLDVSPFGAATYNLPLRLPPGIGGAVPSLALTYSSQAGDGLLGMGWRLDGLSTITRCPRNNALDGEVRGIDFGSEDAYCLDGVRLVDIGGDEFRAQIENFSKIEAFGQAGTGPESFRVTTRDGIQREYGATEDSRIEAQGLEDPNSVRVYALNRQTDLSGNYFTVEYNEDPTTGSFEPSAILYTTNDAAGQAAKNRIDFVYEARVLDASVVRRYVGGAYISNPVRLSEIRTSVDDGEGSLDRVLDYHLDYEFSERRRSRLVSVKECLGGKGDCRPATTFTWADGQAGIDSNFSTDPDDHLELLFQDHNWAGYVPYPGDFDGDGVTDLYMITDGDQYFCSGRSMVNDGECTLIQEDKNWLSNRTFYFGDFDGDAVTEYLQFTSGGVSLCEAKTEPGTANCSSSLPSGWGSSDELYLGDFDGDGRTDVVFVADGSQRFCPASGLVDGTGCMEWARAGAWASSFEIFPGDYNGDGRSDLIAVGDGIADFCDGRVITEADLSGCPRFTTTPNWGNKEVHPGDFNGDGQEDLYLIAQNKLFFCAGSGLTYGEACEQTAEMPNIGVDYDFYFGDFNGDGATDIGRVDDSGVDFCPGPFLADNPSGGASEWDIGCIRVVDQTGLRNPAVGILPGDFDGDGVPDFIVLEPVPVFTPVCDEGDIVETFEFGPYQGIASNGRPFSATGDVTITWEFDRIAGSNPPQCKFKSTFDPFDQVLSGKSYPNGLAPIDVSLSTAFGTCTRQCDFDGNGTSHDYDGYYQRKSKNMSGKHGSKWDYTWESYFDFQGNLQASDCSNTYCDYIGARPSTPPLDVDFERLLFLPPDLRDDSYTRVKLARGRSGPIDVIETVHVGIEKDGTGVDLHVDYAALTNMGATVYTKGSSASYPNRDVQNATFVVGQLILPDGTGSKDNPSTYTQEYEYFDLISDIECRRSLGFSKIEITDSRNGVMTRREYEQNPLLAGRIKKTKLFETPEGGGDQRVATNGTTWVLRDSDSSCEKCKHPVAEVRVRHSYELGGIPTTSTTTTLSQFDNYSNPGMVTTVTDNHIDGVLSEYVETTTTQYLNDQTLWVLGLPEEIEVAATSPWGAAPARTSTTAYDSQGRLQSTVAHPDSPTAEFSTVLQRDARGLVTQTTQSVQDPGSPDRIAIVRYDDYGYPYEAENARGHLTLFEYDPHFGNLAVSEDANGVESKNSYDDFGRLVRVVQDGQGNVYVKYGDCTPSGSCPFDEARSWTQTIAQGQAPVVEYLDSHGRSVGQESSDAAGRTIRSYIVYDPLGRSVASARPYFDGVDTPQETITDYDLLDRPISVTTPGSGDRTVLIDYLPLEVKTTSPDPGEGSQITSKMLDSLGQVVQVVDAHSQATTYEYDGFGSLRRVIDPHLNQTTIDYNPAGQRSALTDPSAGVRNFEHNGFGQLIRTTSPATGRSVETTYDNLGRVFTQTESSAEQNETWTWDYDLAASGIGLPSAVYNASGSYMRVYQYDEVARTRAVTVDVEPPAGWGESSLSGGIWFEYDLYGRLHERRHAPSFANSELQEKLIYADDGTVSEVRTNTYVLWQAQERDAQRRVRSAILANGLTTSTDYDPVTDDVQSIATGGGAVQDLSYSFDALGNLRSRSDQSGTRNLSETFGYDGLNRLQWSQTNGGPALYNSYDALGNPICMLDPSTSNCGGGGALALTYGEGSAGPHAVTSAYQGRMNQSLNVAGKHEDFDANYSYDPDGNQIERFGVASGWNRIDYTAFHKPHKLYTGSSATPELSSEYFYGPEQALVLRRNSSESTSVLFSPVAGLDEWITESGSEKRMTIVVPDGTQIVYKTDSFMAPFDPLLLEYVHTDHLGSSTVVTNAYGDVIDEQSYDAFGRHRDPDTGERIAPSVVAERTTDRAFTGQREEPEHYLYNYGARIYDPTVGRFLQPDTIVQSPYNPQSLNRYSYVFNNPLRNVDPSGNTSISQADAETLAYALEAAAHWGPGTLTSDGYYIPDSWSSVHQHQAITSGGTRVGGGGPIVEYEEEDGDCHKYGWSGPCSITITIYHQPERSGASASQPSVVQSSGEPTLVSSNLSEGERNFNDFVNELAKHGGAEAIEEFFTGVPAEEGYGFLDGLQDSLDAASLALDATGIGATVSWAPDVANAIISLGRGDYGGALLSGVATLPFLGAWANAARLARSAADAPIVIGENMRRVQNYADQVGAQTITDFIPSNEWSLTKNSEWIQEMRAQGREVLDIGPDFNRRLSERGAGNRNPSREAYGVERKALSSYSNRRQLYQRSGRYEGGVPGFD